jgi:hypothetical protein
MNLPGVEDVLKAAELLSSTEVVLTLEAEAEDTTDELHTDSDFSVPDDKTDNL